MSDHELEALVHAIVVIVIAIAAYINRREHRQTRREAANGDSSQSDH